VSPAALSRLRPQRPRTIRQQLMLLLAVLSLLAMVFFSFVLYHSKKEALITDIDNTLQAVAVMAREILPPDYHDRIEGPDSVSDHEYQTIVDRYNRLCVTLGLEYIWSLMIVDGRIVFTSATSPDKIAENRRHATFFEAHSNPELYAQTFESMAPTFKTNFDKWGHIRVALIPGTDRHGRKYLFGASVSLASLNAQLRGVGHEAMLAGLGLFLGSIAVCFWVARAVTSPIQSLTDTIHATSVGGSPREAAERGTHEVVTLAQHFNRLNRALHGKISLLEASQADLIGQRAKERDQAKRSLETSEGRYFNLLNFAVDGIVVGSPDGIITEANECACALFGMAREEIIGKHITALPFKPGTLTSIPFRFDLVDAGQKVVRERTICRPDGSEVTVEIHSKKMANGTYQSIYHDITERKRIEERLTETYRLLEESQRMAKLGAWQYVVVTGQIIWTDEVYRIHGVDKEFPTNDLERALSFYAPEDVPTLRRALQAAVEVGEPFDLELRFIRATGERLWVRSCGQAVREQGKVVRLEGNFMDITERKLAEQALRESEYRYRLLFDMESDALILIDRQTLRFLDANQAAQTLYGYTREELMSLSVKQLSAEPERSASLIQTELGPDVSLLSVPLVQHRKRDGTVFPVEIKGRFLVLDGKDVLIVAVRDITERQKAQALLESWNETLEQRVLDRTAEVAKYAGQLQTLTRRLIRAEETERQRLSHILHEDLQQLLMSARMRLGVACETLGNKADRKPFDNVDDVLERSYQLTRTLVQEIAVPAVKEGELAAAVAWIAQGMRAKFGMVVEISADKDARPVSEEVYLCLYRATQELLFNIVKHAGTLRAEVRIENVGEQSVRLTIRDGGTGFSFDSKADGDKKGNGVGLFGIRERIENLGGQMTITSSCERGARGSRAQPEPAPPRPRRR